MSYKVLPNGHHEWTFRLGGRRGKQKQVTNADYKAGEKEVRKIIYEFENGIAATDTQRGVSFYDICDGYLKAATKDAKKQRRQTLESQNRLFKRDISNHRLIYFNTKGHEAYNAIDTWLSDYASSKNRLGGKIKTWSVIRKFNALKAIFNWAIKRGLMAVNPCVRATRPKAPAPKPRFLDKPEIAKIFKLSPRSQFTNYCSLILNTGMRPGEALGLQIENIDLSNLVISGFDQKKGDEFGTVKIKKSLVAPLTRMIGKRTTGSLLGYTQAQLRADSETVIKAAGINKVIRPGTSKFTIYGLRHTFASHLLMSGESLSSVAGWLRNTEAICERHYGHLTAQFLIASGDKIDLVPDFELKVVGE
jgi:integrase